MARSPEFVGPDEATMRVIRITDPTDDLMKASTAQLDDARSKWGDRYWPVNRKGLHGGWFPFPKGPKGGIWIVGKLIAGHELYDLSLRFTKMPDQSAIAELLIMTRSIDRNPQRT